MTPPPEVLLDRFFRSGRHTDPDTYRGKQDLGRLEPSLGSLLINVQDALNEELSHPPNTFANGRCSKFHFDYADATCPNALAFEHGGYAFIVVTMPLVTALWHTCDHLSRAGQVTELLNLVASDQQREAIAAVLFTTQLAFVVAHEFAHHDRGHFPHPDSPANVWMEIMPGRTAGSLRLQAQEVDSDGWAVYLVLSHLMLGQRREGTRDLLNLQAAIDNSADEILLSSFILAIVAVLSVFPRDVFDKYTLSRLTHPPQAARMNEIMRNVRSWCQQNRPALGAWMTLERFQGLMRAARQAISESNVSGDWSQQTEFFLTEAGAEYFRQLHEEVILLMGNGRSATVVAIR